jgi:predicted transcriptional regulator
MRDPYIHQITTGQKSHEFRKCLLPRTIQRIWFYCTAPHSGIEYICAIAPAQTRGGPNDVLPEESGLGNKEFNEYHEEWTGYDYAFKILSVHQLAEPLPLSELKGRFGTKAAPQGMVYTPRTILEGVDWRKNAVKIL